jgi:hypothetical protein
MAWHGMAWHDQREISAFGFPAEAFNSRLSQQEHVLRHCQSGLGTRQPVAAPDQAGRHAAPYLQTAFRYKLAVELAMQKKLSTTSELAVG